MPSKSDLISINNEKLDRRVKLTEGDKKLIIWLREEEKISYQKLADRFKVSKRLIIFIIKPETKQKNIEDRAKRGGWRVYYDKECNRITQKEHRAYKRQLFEQGLINKK